MDNVLSSSPAFQLPAPEIRKSTFVPNILSIFEGKRHVNTVNVSEWLTSCEYNVIIIYNPHMHVIVQCTLLYNWFHGAVVHVTSIHICKSNLFGVLSVS